MTIDTYSDVKAIISDIEGTITSHSFMKEVLLPYVTANISDYIWDYEFDLSQYLNSVREEEKNPDLNTEEVIEVLLRYIHEGVKSTTLQALQALVLAQGYAAHKVQATVYDDVLRAFKRWREQRIHIYIYSSLSMQEQRLFFSNTQVGDINSSFNKRFDTEMGDKKLSETYERIAASIGFKSSEILFLTNNVEDAIAASNAGMRVIVLDRQTCLVNAYGRRIEHDFDNIIPETVPA
jgi:enolase-phosphatase E1